MRSKQRQAEKEMRAAFLQEDMVLPTRDQLAEWLQCRIFMSKEDASAAVCAIMEECTEDGEGEDAPEVFIV
jgi:hypothetical protein